MEPEYQRQLNSDVKGPRYVGYESSVTNMGAALAIHRIDIFSVCGDCSTNSKFIAELACKCISKADQEPSANEHLDGLGSGLDGGRNAHYGRTKPDCTTTTEAVGQVWGKWIASERTNVLRTDSQWRHTISRGCSPGWH